MSEESRSKGFINRWSSRKQQAGRPRDVAEKAQPSQVESVNTRDHQPEPSALHGSPVSMAAASALIAEQRAEIPEEHAEIDASEDVGRLQTELIDEAPLLSDADMPPIESLSSDSDVSAFFNKGVSAALRKAALRHVFRQPAYNVRDGLNDYDGDYTVFEPLGDTVTSDMKWHIARKERERLEAEARELEQRRLEVRNEQEMEDVQREEEGQAEKQSHETEEAQAEQHSQETAEGQAGQEVKPDQQAQAEQHSQETAEGQAGQEVKPEQQAQAEQHSQETAEGQAGQEVKPEQQSHKTEEAQAGQQAQVPHEALTQVAFDQASQIDADEKDNTRNKPA